jgi:hypothetical protein
VEHAVEGSVLVEAACNGVSIRDVGAHQGGVLHEVGVSGAQVVEDDGIVSRSLQGAERVAADVSRATGDE